MTTCFAPKAFGTGLIALDLVLGTDPEGPVRSWTGGTCGNVLSILAFHGWKSFPIARMNGDAASLRVLADMGRWGVRLDFARCEPQGHTPIIVQQIKQDRHGNPSHRFLCACPYCGQYLPRFKAVTQTAVEIVSPHLDAAAVFFLDRLSRAMLTMAKEAADQGALVVFEPSAKSAPKHFDEALKIAHVLKYADQRLSEAGDVFANGRTVLLEIQTLGEQGLRFRSRNDQINRQWQNIPAYQSVRVVDTCGSGDWCTAGLLHRLGADGLSGFRKRSDDEILDALRYGQALAAWNCRFEGARGGMYSMTAQEFEQQVLEILTGEVQSVPVKPISKDVEKAVNCPACAIQAA